MTASDDVGRATGMRYLPVFIDVVGRSCLVVGAGPVALRKVELLARARARITVVAPVAIAAIESLARQGRIELVSRPFAPGDVDGRVLAYGATGIAAVDRQVARAARRARVPVNVVDSPEECDFITPAVVDRSPLVVAVSSGGAAPVLARQVRALVEASLPANLGRLATFAESIRSAVKAWLPDGAERREFWDRFFAAGLARAARSSGGEADFAAAYALARQVDGGRDGGGRVALVGAGPGDPDLLTLRALQHLQRADVVVYDRLIGRGVLDYARRDAELIYVGKSRGGHAYAQSDISALLAHHARRGRHVVRLKGGDPFVFGRGGEERDYLVGRGIPVEVVPGITAALGCAASAGIPLTHRALARGVTFIAGATDPSASRSAGLPDHDWAALARLDHTLAIYMSVGNAGEIAARLIGAGLDPATPAAVVADGTLPTERVATGAVADLGALVRAHAIRSPALVLIGRVVDRAAAAPAELSLAS
jgi:uroporphyrin-III C-methyltransferase/precorrin-2 dehydrogenase/sirohydrochlorin ferrochelatase